VIGGASGKQAAPIASLWIPNGIVNFLEFGILLRIEQISFFDWKFNFRCSALENTRISVRNRKQRYL
jgi:hypothetical protein